MVSARLASGPVSWGVDFADTPGNPPWREVLDGIRRAGYAGLELGPLGYLPEDPARLRDELAERALALVGGFVFEPLHDPARLEEILAVTRRVVGLVADAGGEHLVVIAAVVPERARTAGRPELAPRLDRDGRRSLTRAVRAVVKIAQRAGLAAAVHPHAGTYVEFEDEIGAAAELAPLCLDTGHAAYAGLDPAHLIRAYGSRIGMLHVKDVDGSVLARRLGFWDAVAGGVFCPAGRGIVRLADVAAALRAVGYSGWATVEQDRVPGGDPVGDLVESRHALEDAGLGAVHAA